MEVKLNVRWYKSASGLPSNFVRKGCCCCAVGMCENSRLRVIHISIAVAAIFLALQVAYAVNDG